jgi:uncharacterized Fe-S center protein
MGEPKNKFYIRPNFVKEIISQLEAIHISPFLYDTTVLYNSPRNSISEYKEVAIDHGFTEKFIGCPVIIDDQGIEVEVQGYTYEVGQTLYHQTHIICLSHVKGHVATGMGGAIKNLGMGGVTKNSKKMMHHGSKPIFNAQSCQYCGICAEVCPFNAIIMEEERIMIKDNTCFGCGVCVENCPSEALNYVSNNLQYLISCAAKACVENKQVLYINDVNRISDSCDCDSYAKTILCPDIGYLISTDPVAIDHASLKLIDKEKKDIFQKTHHINPYKQIEYGENIGLGSTNYEFITLT